MSRNDLPNPKAPNFSDRLRETVMTYLGKSGDPLDRGVTLRDLVDSGFASIANLNLAKTGASVPLSPGKAVTSAYEEDLTPPPAPTGFTATGAISIVLLEHDTPNYRQGHGHLRTRVYGVKWQSGDPLPTFDDAVEVMQFTGATGTLATDPSTTWHLWIKWETNDGVLSVQPAGGTNGVVVTTGNDVSLLLSALEGELTSSQLDISLTSRIDLIDAPDSVLNSVAYRVAQEASARQTAIAAESLARSTAIAAEALARTNAINDTSDNLQNQIDALAAASSGDLGDLIAAVSAEQAARLSADNTFATQISTVVAANNGNIAAIKTEEATRATQDSAQAGLTSLLFAKTNDLTAGVLNEATARTTADSAQTGQVNALLAAAGNATAAVVSESFTRATSDSSAATQLSGLKTSLDTTTAGISDLRNTNATATQALATQVTSITAQTGSGLAAVSTERTARSTETQTLAGQIAGMSAQFGSNTAALNAQTTLTATADSSLASQVTGLAASVAGSNAAIISEQSARALADATSASSVSGLVSTVGQNTASIVQERATSATENLALATQVTSLGVQAGSSNAALVTEQAFRAATDAASSAQLSALFAITGNTSAAIQYEAEARASALGALSSTVSTLQASSGSNTSAIQALSLVTAGPDGATAQYTLKLDVNGYVSGFGLSSANNSTASSSFAIRADSFYIANPEGPGVAPAMPFIVRTTGANVGVYIKDAFIEDGTIGRAKIADLAVDSAKISEVSATKLSAGSIQVGSYIQSDGYAPGSAGWRISGDGSAEFANVTVRGTVLGSTITGGTITGALVRTADSGQRIQMDSQGLLFLTGATSGKHGSFKYGAKKYGSGVLVFFNNASKRVPFYVSAEQNVADIHLYNRGADPVGATHEPGDLICVNGRLKIYVPALGGWKTLALEP